MWRKSVTFGGGRGIRQWANGGQGGAKQREALFRTSTRAKCWLCEYLGKRKSMGGHIAKVPESAGEWFSRSLRARMHIIVSATFRTHAPVWPMLFCIKVDFRFMSYILRLYIEKRALVYWSVKVQFAKASRNYVRNEKMSVTKMLRNITKMSRDVMFWIYVPNEKIFVTKMLRNVTKCHTKYHILDLSIEACVQM